MRHRRTASSAASMLGKTVAMLASVVQPPSTVRNALDALLWTSFRISQFTLLICITRLCPGCLIPSTGGGPPGCDVGDRGSNRPSLRCQRLGRPAARDGHVDLFTGEAVGEGLAYLTEPYNCIRKQVPPAAIRSTEKLGGRSPDH